MAKKKAASRSKKAKSGLIKPTVLANNASFTPIGPRRPRPARGLKVPKPQHVSAVCAVTNPFCPAAKNSKWPDGTNGNTMTSQIRGNTTLSSGLNGNGYFAFASAFPYGFIGYSTTTSSTVTLVANYSPYQTSPLFTTYGAEYRIVSFGVCARAVASATTSSGLITLGTMGTAPAVSSVITLGSELYDEVTVRAVQPGMEVSWIAQPRGATAREFKSASTSTSVTNDWTNLAIELSGCPNSSAMVNIEWFMNIEWTTTVNSAITALARPNPPKSNVAEQAVSTTHSTLGSLIQGGITSVENSVKEHATSALGKFMDDPLDSLAALFAMF
jgi:hypothetical protein